ncbi:tyrosine-protein phosphatase [Stutzerimonas stutzeri]
MSTFEELPNFRDLGGIASADGRVVEWGRLFRSGLISRTTPSVGNWAEKLEVVFDLRSASERAGDAGIFSALGRIRKVAPESQVGLQDAKPIDWVQRLQAPDFDDERARRMMHGVYRQMPRTLAGVFPALFEHCLSASAGRLLIHCQAGKDRTGFVCAILLWALGVPMAEIRRDYLRSSGEFARTGYMAAMLRQAFHDGIPARVADAAAVLGDVSAEFLDASFDQIVRDHGSLDAYLVAVAGLDERRRQQLRQVLLSDAG